jgi:hypothetical protein
MTMTAQAPDIDDVADEAEILTPERLERIDQKLSAAARNAQVHVRNEHGPQVFLAADRRNLAHCRSPLHLHREQSPWMTLT